MPTVPTSIRDAVPVLALTERLSNAAPKKSGTTCKLGSKGKAAITPGVQYVSYPHALQLADRQQGHAVIV